MEQPVPGVQEQNNQPATPLTQLDMVVEPTNSETDSDGLKKVGEAENLPVVPICSEEDGLKKDGEIESVNTVPGSGAASPQKASMLDGKVEMTPAQLRAFRNEGLRVVIGGMLIHLVLGTFYLWGSVSVYVASYLKHYDESITVKLVQLVFPFIKIATNLTMPFGVKLSQRYGPRKVCLSGIIVIAIAVFCTSFIHNFAGVLIVYGLGFGFASGITFVTPVACGWKYFPHKKGVANGAIIGAFGFGTFIFNYVALAIVNPHNLTATHKINGTKYFTEDIYSKVPEMYKVLAGCYLVLGTIGSLMLKDPKITPSNLGPAPQSAKAGQKKDAKPKQIAETLGEGLRTPSYWILVCITTCAAFFGFMLANNYKVYGMTTIADDLFLTTVGSVGSACKGLARFFWSTMMDKFGFKKVFLLLVFIQCVCCGTFIPISHNKACFLIWYVVAMSAEEAAIIPTITAQIFGPKKSSLIYPFVYAGFSIATLSSFFLTYGSLSWPAVFWISFSFSAVCVVLVLMLNETPRFRKEKSAVKIQDPEQPTTPVEEKRMPDNVFVTEEQIILNDLDHIIPEEGGMKKVKDVGINDQKAF